MFFIFINYADSVTRKTLYSRTPSSRFHSATPHPMLLGFVPVSPRFFSSVSSRVCSGNFPSSSPFLSRFLRWSPLRAGNLCTIRCARAYLATRCLVGGAGKVARSSSAGNPPRPAPGHLRCPPSSPLDPAQPVRSADTERRGKRRASTRAPCRSCLGKKRGETGERAPRTGRGSDAVRGTPPRGANGPRRTKEKRVSTQPCPVIYPARRVASLPSTPDIPRALVEQISDRFRAAPDS